jgi:Anti-sigma-K factor rskA, C-terminal
MPPVDVHGLAGAYALDALTDVERAAFARHAAECEVCAREVAELREVTARMAEADRAVPPPRLRRAVLAEVSGTRQAEVRRTVRAAPGARDVPGVRGGVPGVPGVRGLGGSGAGAPDRWRRRAALAVAAAVLVVGGGVAAWAVTQQRLRDERARELASEERTREISGILSAPDARLIRTGQVSLVVSASRDQGVVVLAGLPEIDRAQAYQLWAIRGSNARSIGLLPAGQHTGTVLVRHLSGADTFGVSREPAHGSPQPTAVVQLLRLV